MIKPHQFLSCTLQPLRCRDLDLGPVTLKLNRILDTLKLYHLTKNEAAR